MAADPHASAERLRPVRIFYGLIAAVSLVLAASAFPRVAQSASNAALVEIKGAIGPATVEYVRKGFGEARERGAKLIVVRLDTPGGLASAMREIVRDVLDSPLPVITYVSPSGARAASAGTYILYASHIAAMAPSTHLGAATPVQLGSSFGPRDEEKDGGNKPASEAKAINDAVAYIRGLAELRGRNPDWAESAVRQAVTLTATDAHAQHVIEIVAHDLADLLRQADGRAVRIGDQALKLESRGLAVVTIEPDWRTRILATITNPNIAYILMLVGLYGLLFEFISPGAIFPGVIGGIALLVGLYALNLLPISYAGVGLLLLGMALMIAEAFLPSFGVLGLGGIAAFALGSLFLFDGDVPGFQLSLPVVITGTAASAAFLVIALAAAWRAHRRDVAIGESALRASVGQVLSWADGEGQVQVMGERWQAISAVPLLPGQRVRIIERRDLTLYVEPLPEAPPKP